MTGLKTMSGARGRLWGGVVHGLLTLVDQRKALGDDRKTMENLLAGADGSRFLIAWLVTGSPAS